MTLIKHWMQKPRLMISLLGAFLIGMIIAPQILYWVIFAVLIAGLSGASILCFVALFRPVSTFGISAMSRPARLLHSLQLGVGTVYLSLKAFNRQDISTRVLLFALVSVWGLQLILEIRGKKRRSG